MFLISHPDKFVVGVIDALNNGQLVRGGVVVNIRVTYCPRQSSPGSKCSLRLRSFTCRKSTIAILNVFQDRKYPVEPRYTNDHFLSNTLTCLIYSGAIRLITRFVLDQLIFITKSGY